MINGITQKFQHTPNLSSKTSYGICSIEHKTQLKFQPQGVGKSTYSETFTLFSKKSFLFFDFHVDDLETLILFLLKSLLRSRHYTSIQKAALHQKIKDYLAQPTE